MKKIVIALACAAVAPFACAQTSTTTTEQTTTAPATTTSPSDPSEQGGYSCALQPNRGHFPPHGFRFERDHRVAAGRKLRTARATSEPHPRFGPARHRFRQGLCPRRGRVSLRHG